MAITGRTPLLLALGLVAVLVRPEPSTVWLWLTVVGALVLLDVALAPSPRTLRLERDRPGRVRLGEAGETRVRLSAGPRRVRLLVRDGWQPSAGAGQDRHRVRLGPHESTVLTTALRPTRRGDRRAVGLTVRSAGPLGLAARQRTATLAGSVRALPAFGSRRHLPSRLARLRDLDGRSAVRVRGQGTEFDSLREYVRGDDVRSIDWRASARNRSVVVRTWQPERDRRVVLVLDTSRTSAARVGDVPRLDAAMDAALLLGALAGRAGDRVDLVAGDRRVRARTRAGGTAVVGALSESMADLEPVLAEADWSGLASAVQALGRHRALVVLLTPLEPAAVEESLLPVLPALTAHHRVLLASVRDPELAALRTRRDDAAAVYGAAAAEQTLARRAATASLLERLGVDVLDADADHLAPALADRYLALKAAGRL
ncbi:DUF58 domain-containing protein [Nocardioides bruguierae]|uniref:DUF58 domain-containing protein n=1 Tax=Nocardioides bruguierae TaxID=2945102 RepID=A0A9X2D654_9ACTN|nr:DUF58 domain-containing protein [Nocardioides bruguierae]MCM0619893.1 DUF58 domain-containing protein [Nocardioides bruguierae]